MKLSNLFGFDVNSLKTRLANISPSQVADSNHRKQLKKLQAKQGGFTLLELLVVVAILAAIAGTATIILKDTDRQASAAAHVAMMDELSKGIQTFRVLNHGKFPDNYDSLFNGATATTVAATAANITDAVSQDLKDNLEILTLDAPQVALLNKYGISKVRVIDPAHAHDGKTCGNGANGIRDLINLKNDEDVVAGNIFRKHAASGCGHDDSYTLAATAVLPRWLPAQNERVSAKAAVAAVGGAPAVPADVVIALGLGPDSTLFDPTVRGALSNTPVYRHVAADEYNRFIVLYNLSQGGEVQLQAIVDTAGDTKDEELGEWDNTRSTI